MYHPAQEDRVRQQMETRLQIIKVLLENGCYPHARNKQDKTPEDGLHCMKLKKFDPENLITRIKNFLAQYDSSLTLKYLAAKRIADAKIPYKNTMPKELTELVNLL